MEEYYRCLEPTPQSTETEAQIALSSRSCVFREQYADGSASHWVVVSGTASGPVGGRVFAHTSSGVTATCGSWGPSSNYGCERRAGDTESMQWTFQLNSYTAGSTGEIYVSSNRS